LKVINFFYFWLIGGTGSAFNKDVTMHFTVKIVIIILLFVEKLY